MKNDKFTDDQIADVFWKNLKKDPEHNNRRKTAWGTKTRVGLVQTIKRLGTHALIMDEEDVTAQAVAQAVKAEQSRCIRIIRFHIAHAVTRPDKTQDKESAILELELNIFKQIKEGNTTP